jgi:hypothetical protein
MTENWRDHVKVHPAADLFPTMSDDELDELAADIAKNGLLQPVVFLGEELLDGRNRIAALHRIPDEVRREKIARDINEGESSIIYPFLEDPIGYVLSANLHRRHLNREQKSAVIDTLLKQYPERSDRQIAKQVDASPTTVGTRRGELEAKGEVSKLDTRTDTKGHQRPAHKPQAAAERWAREARNTELGANIGAVVHDIVRHAEHPVAEMAKMTPPRKQRMLLDELPPAIAYLRRLRDELRRRLAQEGAS